MASRTLPNLGLTGFFDLGEDGWDDEMSLNLLRLSVLAQGRVLSKVAAEPGAPTDGDVHILDETHATHANQIAIRDDGAWVYVTPLSGWLLYNVAEDYYEQFDGISWSELVMSGGGGSGDTGYRVGFFFIDTPVTDEPLLRHCFTDAVTFGDDFAGSAGSVGTNPTATFTLDVLKNGVSVGSIEVSTSGVVTFATTGGGVAFAIGDVLSVVAPTSVDSTVAQGSFTFKGAL